MTDERPHKRACTRCGGDMTNGQLRRQEWDEKQEIRTMRELDSTYAHIRAVVENCKHMDSAAIRHQLVGLLPEVQEMDPEVKEQLRAAGMENLIPLHDERVKANWAEYGYGTEEGSDAA